MSFRVLKTETHTVGPFKVVCEWKHVGRLALRYDRMEGLFRLVIPHTKTYKDVEGFLEASEKWMRRIHAREGSRPRTELPTVREIDAFSEQLPEMLSHWQKRMGVPGVVCRLKEMRSRWGSCNPATRSISLSTRLANRPRECQEYVLVHELAHVFEPNHGPKFWAIVEKHCPNWRECREMLKR